MAPLYEAAARGHEAVVAVLLGSGAVVDQADGDGMTPLFGAVIGGHLPVIKLLVSGGASVQVRAANGSLMDCANHFGVEAIVDFLSVAVAAAAAQ